MSYEKIKSIKIDESKGEVKINCASNNVRPLIYEEYVSPHFSKILKEQGLKECEIELLKAFEEGSFQQGNTKYNKALKILLNVFFEEYKVFNWRANEKYLSEEYNARRERRESEEFKALLWKALNTKLPKNKFRVFRLNSHGTKDYVAKETARHIFFTYNIEQAKLFNFEREVKSLAERHGYLIEEVQNG
jgi:hypothetical protein